MKAHNMFLEFVRVYAELILAGRTFKENPQTNKFQGQTKGLLQDPVWGRAPQLSR